MRVPTDETAAGTQYTEHQRAQHCEQEEEKKEGADSEQTLRNSSDGEAAKQTDTERSDEYTRR